MYAQSSAGMKVSSYLNKTTRQTSPIEGATRTTSFALLKQDYYTGYDNWLREKK